MSMTGRQTSGSAISGSSGEKKENEEKIFAIHKLRYFVQPCQEIPNYMSTKCLIAFLALPF